MDNNNPMLYQNQMYDPNMYMMPNQFMGYPMMPNGKI